MADYVSTTIANATVVTGRPGFQQYYSNRPARPTDSMPPTEGRQLVLQVGERPSQNPDYARCSLEWAFYELSYNGGIRYKSGVDAVGGSVFVPHEQESGAGLQRRQNLATFHNLCKPVVQKFNSFVFTSHIGRGSDPAYVEWAMDVDGAGTPLHEFMRLASLRACITGIWYAIIDTTKLDDYQTIAQAQAQGNRMVLSNLHPSRVVDWTCDRSELLTRHDDAGPYGCVRLWTDATVQVAALGRDGKVTSIGAPEPHGWPSMPIIQFSGPGVGQSLISDVAELNKSLFNLDAILREELYKQTFSQTWLIAAGVTQEHFNGQDIGSRKVITVNADSNSAKLDRTAADPTQAQSIRESMDMDVRAIYRIVGLRMPDAQVHGPESGKALKIRFTETSNIAASIADAAELAERRITDLFNYAYGTAVSYPDYPESFDDDDLQQDLKDSLDVIANLFPREVKSEQVVAHVKKRFSNLDVDEQNALVQKVRQFYLDGGADMPLPGTAQDPQQPQLPGTPQTAQYPVKPEAADKPEPSQGAKQAAPEPK